MQIYRIPSILAYSSVEEALAAARRQRSQRIAAANAPLQFQTALQTCAAAGETWQRMLAAYHQRPPEEI